MGRGDGWRTYFERPDRLPVLFDNQINFPTMIGPPEIEGGLALQVLLKPIGFQNHKMFKKSSEAHRVRRGGKLPGKGINDS